MCQVSFDSHLYFQRYALNKLIIIAKIGKENNCINNSDRVMVLAFRTLIITVIKCHLCSYFNDISQYIKFHLSIFNTFRGMLQTNLHN